jgi:hypothetical protein
MKSFALVVLVSCSLGACAGMKEKFSEMSQKAGDASKKATETASAEAAKHDPQRPWDPRDPRDPRDLGPPNPPGSNESAAAADAGAAAASAESGGDAGAVEVTESASETTLSGDAPAASGGDLGYVIDCSKPQNTYAEAETGGTERWGWTDAKKGWFVRIRMANGMEMTEEVKEEREASFLKESRYFQNGQLLSCTLMWTPRLMAKVTGETVQTPEIESKTTDLPDETVSIGGVDVRCTVKRHWTRFEGQESTVVSWTSDQVPNTVVKTVTETPEGSVVVYELLEFRR